ncbi:hypothetical protein MMC13_000230 [Lambiella insularis]|nr:hypothetical protein [Lambiella insularis]
MESEEDFHAIFGSEPNLAYQEQNIHEIQKHRRLLENELFFDRLLKAVGIDQASKLYPPHSNQDLQNLFDRIFHSSAPDHQKQSLIYYILKDLAQEKHRPETFAAEAYLPSRYQIFIDGLWQLDRLKLEDALDALTSPSLIPTFPDEILYTLCRHAPANDSTLPLAYYYSVSPPLASTKTLFAFFDRSCQASLTEAFYFSRSQGAIRHQKLFEQLLTFVHTSAGDVRAAKAVELIHLPLNEEEEQWMEEFLTSPRQAALYVAKDTVMMRKIAKGQMKDAGAFGSKLSGEKYDGVNWTDLREGLQRGSKVS